MGLYLLNLMLLLAACLSACESYDYCLLSPTHTMCKYAGVGESCGKGFARKAPSEASIALILDWHNDIRNNAAAGREINTKTTLHQASNMMKMSWDPELATVAQRLADQCVFQHDCNECRAVEGNRFSVGQNIGIGMYYGSSLPKEINWQNLMKNWYEGEVQIFRKEYVNKYKFGDWGHYSQLIWWNTRSVGCGGSTYTKSGATFHLVVCNYGRSGNILGTKVYAGGRKCSKCPKGTKCDRKYDALCVPSSGNFNVGDSFPTDKQYLRP